VSGVDRYLRHLAEHGFQEGDAPRFRAEWDRLEAVYFDRIDQVTAPFEGWRDRLRAGATETAELVEAYPAEARFLAVDALAAGQVGRDSQKRFASRLAERIDSARAELADPESIPEATSSWIAAIFFDRVYRRCTRPDGPDLPSQLPELLFLAISAYFGAEAGRDELHPELKRQDP
jgi:hypothetical protein